MAENNNLGELLPIRETNGQRAVNARDLHAFLESKQDFSTWIKNRIEQYGFIENQDYQILAPQNYGASWGGNNKIEYALSIDMAKELSMVERTQKGKEARSYFIICEKIATTKALGGNSNSKQSLVLKDQLTWVKETKKLLSLDNHSTLGMLQKIADPLGLPLPEFVDEEAALPISELFKKKRILNKKGKYMSGIEGNKRLLEAGLVEQVSRYSISKGKDVLQWVITKKGEKYGKMHQHKDASFPSPEWFLKTADELMSLPGLSTMEELPYAN